MMMMSIEDLPEADGKEAEIHAHASCSIKKKKKKTFANATTYLKRMVRKPKSMLTHLAALKKKKKKHFQM
jgi:hypothetical protein